MVTIDTLHICVCVCMCQDAIAWGGHAYTSFRGYRWNSCKPDNVTQSRAWIMPAARLEKIYIGAHQSEVVYIYVLNTASLHSVSAWLTLDTFDTSTVHHCRPRCSLATRSRLTEGELNC